MGAVVAAFALSILVPTAATGTTTTIYRGKVVGVPDSLVRFRVVQQASSPRRHVKSFKFRNVPSNCGPVGYDVEDEAFAMDRAFSLYDIEDTKTVTGRRFIEAAINGKFRQQGATATGQLRFHRILESNNTDCETASLNWRALPE